MRTTQEMFDLILGFAERDPRVRAAYLNGSRANPNAPKDIHQDYDVVYLVTETRSFLDDREWLRPFGEPAIVQEPDLLDLELYPDQPIDFSRRYAWLMLFRDHVRIDLSIKIREEALADLASEKMTVVLLDKDGTLPQLPPSTDEDYHVKKPSQAHYHACCNEFWWCLNNVGKGLARDEIPYAMGMYHATVHKMLDRMVEWYIGVGTDFGVSAGKMGKYFKTYLPPELYARYCAAYSDADPQNFWRAVFAATDLFRDLAKLVAQALGFSYIESEDVNTCAYLRFTQGLGD